MEVDGKANNDVKVKRNETPRINLSSTPSNNNDDSKGLRVQSSPSESSQSQYSWDSGKERSSSECNQQAWKALSTDTTSLLTCNETLDKTESNITDNILDSSSSFHESDPFKDEETESETQPDESNSATSVSVSVSVSATSTNKKQNESPREKSSKSNATLTNYLNTVSDMMYPQNTTSHEIQNPTALGFLTSPMFRQKPYFKWSPYEIACFEASIMIYGKRFHKVQQMIKTKNTKDIIEFYYVWKKTDHYQQWKRHYHEPDPDTEDEQEEKTAKKKKISKSS